MLQAVIKSAAGTWRAFERPKPLRPAKRARPAPSGRGLHHWTTLAPRKPRTVATVIATIRNAASSLGARVLAANDERELADHLEELLDDGSIVGHMDKIFAALLRARNEDPQLKLEFVLDVDDTDPHEVAALIEDAKRLREGGEALARDVPDHSVSEMNATSPEHELMRDLPSLPLPVARAVLQHVRGLGAMLALLSADKRPLPGWVALSLARTWRDGELASLRILAVDDESIPEDLLPTSERIDVPRMKVETAESNRRLAQLYKEARESGLPVYPPKDDDGE